MCEAHLNNLTLSLTSLKGHLKMHSLGEYHGTDSELCGEGGGMKEGVWGGGGVGRGGRVRGEDVQRGGGRRGGGGGRGVWKRGEETGRRVLSLSRNFVKERREGVRRTHQLEGEEQREKKQFFQNLG